MRIGSINFYDISFGSRRQFKKMFKTCAYSGEKFGPGSKKTIEHIKPISQGGENCYPNYLVVKKDWNEKRSSTPLGEFIRQNPEVEEHIKNAVTSVEGRDVEGIDWASEVKKTLKEEIGRDIFEE
ncbi:hypothetical protein IKQ26_08190 [bacterium]|nr:hypothetical protein [bacterium]